MTDRLVLRDIAWKEVFPGVILARVFRCAIRPQLLLVTGLCLGLTSWGWNEWIGSLFDASLESTRRVVRQSTSLAAWQSLGLWTAEGPLAPFLSSKPPVAGAETNPLVGPGRMACALAIVFNPTTSFGTFLFLLLVELWGLTIWSFGAAVVTRLAVVEFAQGERIGLSRGVRYASARYLSYLGAVGIPIAVILLATLPAAILGLLMRFGVGMALAAIAWPLVLLLGLLSAVVLVGLVVGWPLLWTAVSAEGTDAFDAVGRIFSYLSAGALQLLGYSLVAGVLGFLGWFLVYAVSELTIQLAFWATSWGSGVARTGDILAVGAAGSADFARLGTVGWLGARAIHGWSSLLRLLVSAYITNFTLVAAAPIYLLLRELVDGKEATEVYLPDKERAVTMPPLPVNVDGVPGAPGNGPTITPEGEGA